MTSPTALPRTTLAVGGVQTVRRVITYLLLAVTVIIAANGLSGLVERLLTINRVVVSFDNYGLATSLAFALIAGPIAAALWWQSWREASSARDRASVMWPVYLVVMSTAALITFTIAIFSWATALIVGDWQPSALASGLVWGLVWLWHYWMWRHPRKGPTRLQGAAPAIASFIGLAYAAGGVLFAVGRLIDSVVESLSNTVVVGDSVMTLVLQPLVWAVGGALLWWWHWFRVGVRALTTGFATVLLVFITGIASLAVAALGLTLTLWVVLQLVTAAPQPLAETLSPLGSAIASALIGALVFVYHSRVSAATTADVRAANRLANAGVSLGFAATGIGVTINALLGILSDSLIEGDIRTLLLGGLSSLVVGGALWWATWQPASARSTERASTPGRRVYLVVIFGLSALVALITLLVIGFQLFSLLLDGTSGDSFIERSRQALGLLTATVLVAAYHFAIWNGDRRLAVDTEHPRRIGQLTLVTSTDNAELVEAIRAATGARVTVLRRADAVKQQPDDAAIVAALDGVEANRVLVIVGSDAAIQVIRLED